MKEIRTLNDLTTFLDPYRIIHEEHTQEQYEEIKKHISENLDLPTFYTFPTPTPVYNAEVIADATAEKGFVVKITDDQNKPFGDETYYNLTSAYEAIQDVKADCVFVGDLEVAGADRAFVTEGNRLLISFTDAERISLAKNNYLNFLFSTERYYNNRNDFYMAFLWVKHHPAFWYRHREEYQEWETNYSGFWFEITKNKDNDVVYMLEAGAAIEPARLSHYHDLRLDVYASSFEEAYIQLAALVDKFFNLDGSERENVSYKPSELEVTLKESLARYEQELGDNED